jgi:hypothetical protein
MQKFVIVILSPIRNNSTKEAAPAQATGDGEGMARQAGFV